MTDGLRHVRREHQGTFVAGPLQQQSLPGRVRNRLRLATTLWRTTLRRLTGRLLLLHHFLLQIAL